MAEFTDEALVKMAYDEAKERIVKGDAYLKLLEQVRRLECPPGWGD